MALRVGKDGRVWDGRRVYTGRASVPGAKGYSRFDIRFEGDTLVTRYGWSKRMDTLCRRVMVARRVD